MALLRASDSKPLGGGPSFSLRSRVFRFIWQSAWIFLASWTPPQLHCWRRLLLNLFGANIGRGAKVYSSVRIWYPPNLEMKPFACLGPRVSCYSMAKITIGTYAVVSQDAELCAGTHDIQDPEFQLIASPISVEDRAWVAAGAFVGPGVVIGNGAVLGARAVTFRDIPDWSVYSGNPAVFLKQRRRNSVG